MNDSGDLKNTAAPRGSKFAWQRLHEMILKYTKKTTWVRNEIDDVASEVLAALVAGSDKIQSDIRLLEVKIVNLIRAELRRRRRWTCRHISWDLVANQLCTASPQIIHGDPLVGTDDANTLRSCYQRLPEPYRTIIALKLIDRGSHREVAKHLYDWRSIGSEQARSLARRAQHMLVVILHGGDPICLWPDLYAREKNPWLTTPPPKLPVQ